jgi:hypothetical protein
VRIKRIGAVVAWCGLLGGLAAMGTYLAIDFTPFGGDIIDLHSRNLRPVAEIAGLLVPFVGRRLALLPDILAGFLLTRLPGLLVQAAVVVHCLVARQRQRLALALSIGVPLLYEVALACISFDASWLGMLWALAINWPARPEYVVPLDFAACVAAAYLLPALASGLGGWLALRFMRAAPLPTADSA